MDSSILDFLITGRTDPQIYAFYTNTIPNYLKVGDSYRPVRIRLNEWRRFFPDLIPIENTYSARIDDEHFFRDYSVHDYLLHHKHRDRLLPEQFPHLYYSNEFFKDATDIRKSAVANDGRYRFYGNDRLPALITSVRDQDYSPRENQAQVIQNFKMAVENGRKNLLMYAVMRFGKTFTAMCCACEINAHLIIIVSAKADVRREWKGIIERHKRFERFAFVDSETLDRTPNIISMLLENNKDVALFLTLQDLQGDIIKARHKDVFNRHVDLLIIDETHFGARAEEYGKVLQLNDFSAQQQKKELLGYDETVDSLINTKTLGDDQTIRLHLSGTPYRILMGNEFQSEDIVAFVRFADIVEAQRAWDEKHFIAQEKDSSGIEIKEWDNPYYGFPQMIRFAFNPSQRAREKLKELKQTGTSYALSALFRAKSMTEDRSQFLHREFIYESEILDFLKAIDGTEEDESILAILDDSRIKKGEMCHHIVCVLPFRTSCDALGALLAKHAKDFRNWKDYVVINAAGFDTNINSIGDLRHVIDECEKNQQKTITLTVNRFLTGSTVEQWDTMLFFKETSSPQEYDQAIFRLQNPYIKTVVNGNQTIKFNMKPQTLLVDFDPDRMFQLQELKALFYNTNSEQRGNDALRKCIDIELKISPIITINCGKLGEITPQNIIDAVRNYNANKSILDEATSIPFDNMLLENDELRDLLVTLKPLKDRKGIEMEPSSDEGTDLDVPIPEKSQQSSSESTITDSRINDPGADDNDNLEKRLAAYYMRILFYAFLIEDEITSLKQAIQSIDASNNNLRISQHVGIKKHYLQLIFERASEFKLTNLDCKIENINTLGRDTALSPIERAAVAMRKLSRISESEIVTPQNVAADMVEMINPDLVNPGTVVLDMASKQGEMTFAFHKKYSSIPNINYYSIATSKLTYELTRKVYKALELPEDHVFNFTSFSLIGDDSEKYIEHIKAISPDIILAAPPYNKSDGGGRVGSGSGTAIYQHFFNIATSLLNPKVLVMYLKSNWYSGGRGGGLADFRERMLLDHHISVFHDYPNPKSYIDSDVNLRGGICTFMWEQAHNGKCIFYNHINGNTSSVYRYLLFEDLDYANERILIRFNSSHSILQKVQRKSTEFIEANAFTRNQFDLQSNTPLLKRHRKGTSLVYLPKGKKGYIYKKDIPNYKEKEPLIDAWKVIVAKASPGEDDIPHAIISAPIVSEPGSLCTDSHLVVRKVDNQFQAENFAAYMKTRFFRFMMFIAKNGQNMTKSTFRFVPVLDLDRKWCDDEIYDYFDFTVDERAFIDSMVTEPRA